MNEPPRLKGIAEFDFVHRDTKGNILYHEHQKGPVTYVLGPNGQPMDIRRVGT